MISRRELFGGLAIMSAGTMGAGGYALAEPFRLRVTHYRLSPPRWQPGLTLRIAVLADLHACAPWMGMEIIAGIVARTNALRPDATLLLGDFVAGHRLSRLGEPVPHEQWAGALAGLEAPLGVHAVLGNHDWWEDAKVQEVRKGPVKAGLALEAMGIPVYENHAVRLTKNGLPFWIAGLSDQWAFWPDDKDYDEFVRGGRIAYHGAHDLAGTLAKVADDAPVIMMAHEPDIFAEMPSRVSLTISGHTHGGQVRFAGFAPVVPSKYGRRYVYGHVVEEGRNLIVSGGLGCSGMPVRFGSPPEIVLIDLSTGANFA
ncbi:MAG: metallophosphoesterase [Hyphomicrobium sp.]